jgi:TonB family protein
MLRLRHPRTLLVYWQVLLIVVLLLPLAPLDRVGQAAVPLLTLGGLRVNAAVTTALPTSLPDLSVQLVAQVIAAVSVLAVVRLAFGLAYLKRCLRSAHALSPAPAPVVDLQARFGLEVPFLVSTRLDAPLTFGWFQPAVLLPVSFRDLSADQQEAVVCHELLHVRRRDWPMTLLEELVRAVFWFHPAVWLIVPRIALSRERLVDAETVRLTGKRRSYLEALWRVISSGRQSAASLATPFLARRDLLDRVMWLQQEIIMSKTRIACSILVLAVTVPAVAVFGANVFRCDPAFASSNSGAATKEEPEHEKKGPSERKLETVSAETLCDEITMPVLVEKVNPVYPPSAREEKVTGTVIVNTVVTEDGMVDAIEVVESPDERLSAAAVEAIKKWQFEPALCDGKPVAVYYNLTVNFRLE